MKRIIKRNIFPVIIGVHVLARLVVTGSSLEGEQMDLSLAISADEQLALQTMIDSKIEAATPNRSELLSAALD